MTLVAMLKSMKNIAVSSIKAPDKTTIIDRERGDIVKRYNTWNEYLREENNYPYSRYITVRGLVD